MKPTELFKLVLRQIGVLGRGQNVSSEQLNETQSLCNMMLGQWARKRWLIFHLVELYTQGTGSSQYAMGVGDLEWDAQLEGQSGLYQGMNIRTNRIEKAFVRLRPGTTQQSDIPLQVVQSYEDYSLIPAKNITSGFPQAVFLDTGYPTATLNVWPAPSSAYEIHIVILNPLVRLTDLTADINLPDEYQDAIFWNLAKRLRSSYGKVPDPEVNAQAMSALNTVKNANFQLARLHIPAELTRPGWYNIYMDGYA